MILTYRSGGWRASGLSTAIESSGILKCKTTAKTVL